MGGREIQSMFHIPAILLSERCNKDFPGGTVGKNPHSPLGCRELGTTGAASHAHQYSGHGFDPWSGRIPRAAKHLGLCVVTNEPVHCNS